jgi:hypothetical protein
MMSFPKSNKTKIVNDSIMLKNLQNKSKIDKKKRRKKKKKMLSTNKRDVKISID